MKPPPFRYAAPTSLDEAVAILAREGPEAKLLAGGQSLVPLLNMRLARPTVLVDLNRVAGLADVAPEPDGYRLGALVRQRTVERDAALARAVPLLHEAISCVGHAQIRNRGTVGGSLAHADPAAELPAVALCLDARITVRGAAGTRELPAAEVFLDYLTTALAPDEVLTEVWLPRRTAGTGQAWLEFSRRHGDFAIAGVGVSLRLEGGRVRQASIALTGVAGRPVRASAAEAVLVAAESTGPATLALVRQAVSEALDPPSDVHATGDYRRHLAGVLAERAVRLALARAAEDAPP